MIDCTGVNILLVGQDVTHILRKNGYGFLPEEDGLTELLSLAILYLFAATTLKSPIGRCFLGLGASTGLVQYYASIERQFRASNYLRVRLNQLMKLNKHNRRL